MNKKMDIQTIKKRIEEIRELRSDYKLAHGLEDNLYIDFIKYIARQKGEYAKEAREILKTDKIDFNRYCA